MYYMMSSPFGFLQVVESFSTGIVRGTLSHISLTSARRRAEQNSRTSLR